jgi:hypothetical protein
MDRALPVRSSLAAVTVLAAVALPSAAAAKRYVWGSDLRAPANRIEAHPVDAAFWNRRLPGGARVRVPVKGRVSTLRLKGTAIKRGSTDPVTLFHFQVLHPTGDGRLRVSLTSGHFHAPVGGDPQQISIYHPVNLCAKKGDFVSFSDVGGYQRGAYPSGTPFRVFSSVPESTTGFFTQSGGINNTNVFTPKPPHVGEELLVRITLVTGDAAGWCRNH